MNITKNDIKRIYFSVDKVMEREVSRLNSNHTPKKMGRPFMVTKNKVGRPKKNI